MSDLIAALDAPLQAHADREPSTAPNAVALALAHASTLWDAFVSEGQGLDGVHFEGLRDVSAAMACLGPLLHGNMSFRRFFLSRTDVDSVVRCRSMPPFCVFLLRPC